MDRNPLIDRIVERTSEEKAIVGGIVDAPLEEIYESLRREPSDAVFKCNPYQRLRAIFGWSSIYQGDL